MSSTMIIGAGILLVVGIVLFIVSNKEREQNGEWSTKLQWGYLMILIGLFGLLSIIMSFTAVLLLFVLITGVTWFIHRRSRKKNDNQLDNNHFTDYMSGFFPIILVVFVLRTFIAEPFQIPSSSMRPGLIPGDFILVNKFSYGIRVPILNNVLIPTGKVQRGDVIVFNYPENPKINYIKRVVGLPGDTIEYKDKVLTINNERINDLDTNKVISYTDLIPKYGALTFEAKLLTEQLGNKKIEIFQLPQQPAVLLQNIFSNFPNREMCTYYPDGSGFNCKVP